MYHNEKTKQGTQNRKNVNITQEEEMGSDAAPGASSDMNSYINTQYIRITQKSIQL